MTSDPRREAFKRRGKCAVCGVRKPARGRVTCRHCLDRQAIYNATAKQAEGDEQCHD